MALSASNFSPAARAAMAVVSVGGLTAQTVANVAGSVPAGGVGAAAGGWDTAPNRDTAITTTTEIKTVVNNILAALDAMGLPITVT